MSMKSKRDSTATVSLVYVILIYALTGPVCPSFIMKINFLSSPPYCRFITTSLIPYATYSFNGISNDYTVYAALGISRHIHIRFGVFDIVQLELPMNDEFFALHQGE